MKVLLHTCCAPCSVKCIDELQKSGEEPTIFWFNPNIHPYTEYKIRKNTLIEYSKTKNLQIIIEENYGLREFIKSVYPDFNSRCKYCYSVRLEKTAQKARELGFDYFSTTLLISPYQNHEMICEVAESVAKKYGVKFLYKDFRPFFREGQKIARELGMYMQKYCG